MTLQRFVPIMMLSVVTCFFGTPRADQPQPSPASSSTAKAATPITLQMANDVTERIVREIEELRGLKFKKVIPVKVIDDDQAREYLLARLARFGMQRQMEMTGEAYGLLGLLPGKLDMVEVVLDVMREQAGGFYDPAAEVFYLLSDMPAVMLPMITAHELTHALEDQHFDLDSRLEQSVDDDDRLFAVSAVHEGSAMVLMSLFSARRLVSGVLDPVALEQQVRSQEAQQKALVGLPPVLLRQMLGPYVLGASFLARGNLLEAMMTGFPTKDVNGVFEAGPLSSEQILHPEKYWDPEFRDDPRDVAIQGVREVLGRRWRRVAEGVLGELVLGVMVGAETPATDPAMMMRPPAVWTNRAASGWGGDRWELWKRGRSTVVVAAIEWDTEEDVQEFIDALPAQPGLAIDHRGDRLVLVAGDAGKKKAALLAALLHQAAESVVPTGGNR